MYSFQNSSPERPIYHVKKGTKVNSSKALSVLFLFLFQLGFMLTVGAQSIEKIDIQKEKGQKGELVYSLKMTNFPQDAYGTKKLVSEVSGVEGVQLFNILSHPPGGTANGVLTLVSGSDAESVLRSVLCKLNGKTIQFKKRVFSSCESFTLTK